jgi:S1-C subfamily serine protease
VTITYSKAWALSTFLFIGCTQHPTSSSSDAGTIQKKSKHHQLASEKLLPAFDTLFKTSSKSVVNISASHPMPIPKHYLRTKDKKFLRSMVTSLGSGFVIDALGHVITCSSVVSDAREIEVVLKGGRRLAAKIVGSDSLSDIAILAINPAHSPPPLSLGDTSTLKVGDWVAAFGHPFGLSHSITVGIVSAIRSKAEMKTSFGTIISDASINPGCNGGPLLNTAGEVVGINFISSDNTTSFGLAIPIDDVRPIIKSLLQGKKLGAPWLGVALQHVDVRLAKSFGLDQAEGALVSQVSRPSPADKAGLKTGDIIISFGGRSIEDPTALIETITKTAIGIKTKLQIYRRGRKKTLSVVLQRAP